MSSAVASIASLTRRSSVRFLIVGGLSVATDTGALFVFHGVLGLWLPVATVLAFATAFVVNFGLNRVWAFGATGAVGGQVWRYLALVLVNLVATVLLVQGLTWAGLPYLVAKVVTAGALAAMNYVVSKKWIFI
ncbi:GtrA family protein [Micromonospora zhanjiangensis]|uniref:GtrA family protein n=1 Tax=Micromonospora zhanjiangensis TaxID=1522057 RepID=A0ABV8KSQ8_9ACTN